MNLKQQIAKLEQQMRLREIADDGYYLSRQYKEDSRALYELQTALKAAVAAVSPPKAP